MRVYFFIALVSALLAGCQSPPAPTHSALPAPTNTTLPPPGNTIVIGMPLREAGRVLDGAQAKDITENVGIFTVQLLDGEAFIEDLKDHWYILADNTCLHLTSGRTRGYTNSTIQSISLGEKGKGYPDKFEWLKQERVEMRRLDL